MSWVLNIVGEVEKDVQEVVDSVLAAAKDAGHKINSVRVTTDAGERVIDVPASEEAPVEAPVEETTPPPPEVPAEPATEPSPA